MKRVQQRILLEKQKEVLEQYDSYESEEIETHWPKYAKSIGEFLISFSILESSLNRMIVEFVDHRADDEGFRIIKYLRFKSKIDFASEKCRLLIGFIGKDSKRKLNKAKLDLIIRRLKEISEFRNKIVHANWSTLKKGFVMVKIDTDEQGWINFKNVKMTPFIIRKLIRETDTLIIKIEDFQERLEQDLN